MDVIVAPIVTAVLGGLGFWMRWWLDRRARARQTLKQLQEVARQLRQLAYEEFEVATLTALAELEFARPLARRRLLSWRCAENVRASMLSAAARVAEARLHLASVDAPKDVAAAADELLGVLADASFSLKSAPRDQGGHVEEFHLARRRFVEAMGTDLKVQP